MLDCGALSDVYKSARMYNKVAMPSTFVSIYSGSIIDIVSPAV